MRGLHGLAAAALAVAAAILLDQGSKTLVRGALRECTAPPVILCDRVPITGSLGILHTTNDNGAFGIRDAGVLVVIAIAAMVLIGLAVRRRGFSTATALSIGLLVGGSVSNLIDRIAFGTVTDFIDIRSGFADVGLVLNPADLLLAFGGLAFWVAVAVRRPDRRAGVDRAANRPQERRAGAEHVTQP